MGRSKRVRRRFLRKPHTLQEALDFAIARAQELADRQAKEIEMEQHSRETNFEEELCKVGPSSTE